MTRDYSCDCCAGVTRPLPLARRQLAVVALLVCIAIAGAAAVVPVHAINGLDGAAATFYSGSRCSSPSGAGPPLVLTPAICMANITFNSSVRGEAARGRVSVWDTADYYHDKCAEPYYWVYLDVWPDRTDCGSFSPPDGDVSLSYWHCVNDGDGDGVCCGLAASQMEFTHANITYRSVSFAPRTNPKSCGGSDNLAWWGWLLIVLITAVFGVLGWAIKRYCRRRELERYQQSHHTLFDEY